MSIYVSTENEAMVLTCAVRDLCRVRRLVCGSWYRVWSEQLAWELPCPGWPSSTVQCSFPCRRFLGEPTVIHAPICHQTDLEENITLLNICANISPNMHQHVTKKISRRAKASVRKRRGMCPIRTEISTFKIRKKKDVYFLSC